MNVVLVTVMGSADGDDGFQCSRRIDICLKTRSGAPRGAEHADLSITPRLASQPFDHVAGII
jgi:hypothetical protein